MAKAFPGALVIVLLVNVPLPSVANDAPAGFAGSWLETSVHTMQGIDYPDGTPEDWYGGKVMSVGTDRLTFADDVCFGPTYTKHHGKLSQVLLAFTRDKSVLLKRDFGVNDAGPFDYLEVRCNHGQYLRHDPKLAPIIAPRRDYHPWFLVKVAPNRIEMPFTHGTWIKLSIDSPTS